ncbi:MAG: hypothetical protein HC836_13330 [Richelia sp. RM2_1_2]|nr:hypothetical protein [Richelia sp. SM2_1_7]NJM19556.1 hypothetical protein [Richelia sp. SM1_7_0]NJN08725.1 hypothetical protein [Richelia sp. RM1_1_1]NJO27651.1 hypothetical protein [Richelia sp. SL_2_1]NJO59255.1 hypothetical protein [Richelia sp. RM2_1_2]NJS16281.1 hypothetical protein [Nostocaceae cyanobacterium CSU_2_110]
MARLYADEQFPYEVVENLHRSTPNHAGIIICTDDADRSELAERINVTISTSEPLVGKLISVVRPVK